MPRFDGATFVSTAGAEFLGQDTVPEMRTYLGLDNLLGGSQNVIRNPSARIYQRGSSQASTTVTQYFLDGWQYLAGGSPTAVVTLSSDTASVPLQGTDDDRYFARAHKVEITTADVSLGASDAYSYRTIIEGFLWYPLMRQGCTLSFWVRSPKSGAHAFTLRNPSNDGVISFTYTINTANTWQYVTQYIPSNFAGTWDFTDGNGVAIDWWLGLGSGYGGAPEGVWADASVSSALSTQTYNLMDATGSFHITDARLVAGATPDKTPMRKYHIEQAFNQRYFYRSPTIGDLTQMFYGHTHYGSSVIAPIPWQPDPVKWRNPAGVTATMSTTSNFQTYSLTGGGWGSCGIAIYFSGSTGGYFNITSNYDADRCHLFRRNGGTWYYDLNNEL